jgi:hypothetical protein
VFYAGFKALDIFDDVDAIEQEMADKNDVEKDTMMEELKTELDVSISGELDSDDEEVMGTVAEEWAQMLEAHVKSGTEV